MMAHARAHSVGPGAGPLIAFVHIPKTAGGTAPNVLAAAYSRGAVHYLRGPGCRR
jgi:hypothetical protein